MKEALIACIAVSLFVTALTFGALGLHKTVRWFGGGSPALFLITLGMIILTGVSALATGFSTAADRNEWRKQREAKP